tara:strand:+ start:421 stop:666 length:246 start_codon:yes stop_codon:yes gene_type:complete
VRRPSKTLDRNTELIRFGKAVRSLRVEMGMSQETLAHIAGLDRSYMGGIERGEHNVALINIKKIASALGVSVHQLMLAADI